MTIKNVLKNNLNIHHSNEDLCIKIICLVIVLGIKYELCVYLFALNVLQTNAQCHSAQTIFRYTLIHIYEYIFIHGFEPLTNKIKKNHIQS